MIVLYKGRRGSGKTLSMVKDGFQYKCDGFKVLRNFECGFGEEITNEEILNLDKNSELYNLVIMIDEIQIFFDSRTSMKKENRRFSNFIQQIRKRNIIILCTTQYSNTIDLRLRQHVDVIAHPRFVKELNVCEVIYIDVTSQEDDLIQELMSGNKPERRTLSSVKIVYDAIPVYRLYNTGEMVR